MDEQLPILYRTVGVLQIQRSGPDGLDLRARKLHALVKQDGYALVPLSVYFKDSRVKLEIGLCRGKKNYDKRAAASQRDAKREIDRTLKERNR